MTTPTTSTTGTAPSLWTGTTSTTPAATGDQMNKDTFLKLLVAQLKYQDPSKPTDSSQFMAQTAQFTLVEKMEALNTAQSQVLASTQLQAATGLVGRSVTWNDNGTDRTGIVSAVTITDGTPTLQVGAETVAMSSISKVAAAPAG